MESKVVVPAQGKKITLQNGKLNVPENPIIPYIEGDGIGVDVTPAMLKVVDAAVEKAYKGERKISWMEIYTGEKSTQVYGQDVWLPAETLDLIREYRVAIKGPLTTPVGGGIRSLNVALRQELDLYICLRPVRYYQGTPSPVKHRLSCWRILSISSFNISFSFFICTSSRLYPLPSTPSIREMS